jgi:hypothetical protein
MFVLTRVVSTLRLAGLMASVPLQDHHRRYGLFHADDAPVDVAHCASFGRFPLVGFRGI